MGVGKAGPKPAKNVFFAMCWIGFIIFYLGKIIECAMRAIASARAASRGEYHSVPPLG